MEVAGARVIAEPGPQLEHVLDVGLRQRRHGREPRHEPRVIGRNRRHGGLLQHDLGKPHPIGIGGLARRCPPRQGAAMAVIPGEQGGGVGAGPSSPSPAGGPAARHSAAGGPGWGRRSASACADARHHPPGPLPTPTFPHKGEVKRRRNHGNFAAWGAPCASCLPVPPAIVMANRCGRPHGNEQAHPIQSRSPIWSAAASPTRSRARASRRARS